MQPVVLQPAQAIEDIDLSCCAYAYELYTEPFEEDEA